MLACLVKLVLFFFWNKQRELNEREQESFFGGFSGVFNYWAEFFCVFFFAGLPFLLQKKLGNSMNAPFLFFTQFFSKKTKQHFF